MNQENQRSFTEILHLFVFVSLAVAQPVYDILGQNAEFFVARRADSPQILSAMLLLSIGIAGVLGCAQILVQFVLARTLPALGIPVLKRRQLTQGLFHTLLVYLLVVLILAPIVKRLVGDSDAVMGAVVLSLAFLFVRQYVAKEGVRSFITALSPVIVFFPLWFVFATPVGRLILPQTSAVQGEIHIKSKVPVVLVVLDELGTTALLNAQHKIDAVRYPHFAEFAAHSVWFPNAVAASRSTEFAVPAILTGRNPRPAEKLLPTATDYPENLFALLGSEYAINASEGLTSLARIDRSPVKVPRQEYVDMFADIAVIYLHLVMPPGVTRKLPSLDARWSGFGQGDDVKRQSLSNSTGLSTSKDQAGSEALSKAATPPETPYLTGRVEQLMQFLAGIEGGSRPELHFIHVLLPHVPYHFLASGHVYASGSAMPEGVLSGTIAHKAHWTTDPSLIITAYHRYLQQVGYVDNFLGDLKKRLTSAGLYDDALVIITADHGVAFRPGSYRRDFDEDNVIEILKIPLLVKLPRQQTARVDERIASSIDILPTIIDVLDIEVAWDVDGYSLLAEQESSRTDMEIAGLGRIEAVDIRGFSRLNWQIAHFKENQSLDGLVPFGPSPQLAKRKVTDFVVGNATSLTLKGGDAGYFDQINKTGRFLPALFHGHIEGSTEKGLPIALSVNGRIWATTRTSQWNEQENYFSILFPPDAFNQGKNSVDAFLIEQSDNGPVLRPIRQAKPPEPTLQRTAGGEILRFPDGRQIRVELDRRNMNGYLDTVTLAAGMFSFEGWAADLVERTPATSILVFEGETLVQRVAPDVRRAGVAKLYDQPGMLRSGYRASVPLSVLSSPDISVVALSGDRRAFKLAINASFKELIDSTFMQGYRLRKLNSGARVLLFPDGHQVKLEFDRSRINGYLDRIDVKDGLFSFEGWAVDLLAEAPVRSLLVFDGEQLLYQASPDTDRRDVADALKNPGFTRSGYRILVSEAKFSLDDSHINVIALSAGKAFKMHITDEYRQLFNRRLPGSSVQPEPQGSSANHPSHN